MNHPLHYDYEIRGNNYASQRQSDPHIARYIHQALGDARTIVNVGAGTGSYEPEGRYVIAVEPSSVMRTQRPSHIAVAINAQAEKLPFDNNSFDASMALLTIHHWDDMEAGLREMRRVTRHQMVIVTFDIPKLANLWVTDYGPEIVEVDLKRFSTIDSIVSLFSGNVTVEHISLPLHCTDGILEAYYGRPEAYLNKQVRDAQSIRGCLPNGVEGRIVEEIERDLTTGRWDERYGHLRTQPYYDSALRIITVHK